MTQLAGRTALVTGAGAGLGREIAAALAAAGAHVILHGREPGRLRLAADVIAAAGGSVEVAVADLGDEGAAAELMTACGRIDILVNNAAARDRRPLGGLDREAVRQLLEINLIAPFDLARLVSAGMSEGAAS